METIKDINIIQELLKLPILSQLVDTIQVDSQKGEIIIENISKNKNNIEKISDKIEFKLKTHRLIVKNSPSSTMIISDLPSSETISSNENILDRFCSDISRCFISDINSFKNAKRYKFKYFNQSIFKKILNRNKKSDLLKYILDISKSSSWIIISNSIFNLIKDTEAFEYQENNKKYTINKCGKLFGINVYLNKSEVDSIIYFGNNKSVTTIINRNFKQEDIKYNSVFKTGKSLSIDYLFLETGEISILKVE